jgi:small-conductance mechanosensitive channel
MSIDRRLILIATLAASAALPETALAQAAIEPDAANTVTTLANMVRWSGIAASLVVMACAWLFLGFLDRLVDRIGDAFAEYRLLFQKISTFVRFGVYFVTIMLTILLSFQISREVLAILGGTAAVAFGFAVKDLVASLVAGVMIMFDRPFQVGDRVEFGGEYGDIVSIGLRSVKLRTLEDSIVTIPNNMFLNQVTSCGNYGVVNMQIKLDFLVGVDQNAERARAIVREVAVISRYVYLPNPVEVLVNQVVVGDYLALRIRLKAYILDTKFEKAFETDVTLRVLEAFAAEGIQPPAVLHRPLESAGPRPLRAVAAPA